MNDRVVITVIGTDKPGIVSGVSTKLSHLGISIVDITQKVFKDKVFAMIMLVESGNDRNMKKLHEEFKILENELEVKIFLQHEDIFKTMHRI